VTLGGTVRAWYVAEGAATRWRYALDVRRRVRGCSACSRRIRIADRRGGTLAPRARTGS
jgi:hypothetical protein